MALSLKPSSHANSRKTAGRSSPLLKSKNLFTRYVDILNVDSSQSPQASASTAASASTSASASRDSVSDNNLMLFFSLSLLFVYITLSPAVTAANVTFSQLRCDDVCIV